MAAVIMLDLLHLQKRKHQKKKAALSKLMTDKKQKPLGKCRVCLNEGDIPIFDDESSQNIAQQIKIFADIEVREDDHLPKALCQACHSLLRGAIVFRQTARDTDMRLRGQIIEIEWERIEESEESREAQQQSEDQESKPYKQGRLTCPVCNLSFVNSYLPTHMARLHSGEKPFCCELCGKSFAVNLGLQNHLLTHTDDMPFKCPQCPYKGRFKASLRLHMRQHTGEKPYSCHQCAAQFGCPSNFRNHMRTHKKDHEFKCEKCDRGFHVRSKLKNHIEAVHEGRKDHECDICKKKFGFRKRMMRHRRLMHTLRSLPTGRTNPTNLSEEQSEKEKINSSSSS